MKKTADQLRSTLDYATIEIENAMLSDDYADAFVGYAEHKSGAVLTDEELDTLSDDTDYVYELAWEQNH